MTCKKRPYDWATEVGSDACVGRPGAGIIGWLRDMPQPNPFGNGTQITKVTIECLKSNRSHLKDAQIQSILAPEPTDALVTSEPPKSPLLQKFQDELEHAAWNYLLTRHCREIASRFGNAGFKRELERLQSKCLSLISVMDELKELTVIDMFGEMSAVRSSLKRYALVAGICADGISLGRGRPMIDENTAVYTALIALWSRFAEKEFQHNLRISGGSFMYPGAYFIQLVITCFDEKVITTATSIKHQIEDALKRAKADPIS